MTTRLKASLIVTCLAIAVGITSGLFLFSLESVTNARLTWPWLMLFLPMAGFLSGWIDLRFGHDIQGGANLLLDEIQEPQKVIPLKFGGLVWIGTLIGHLFGASVGREGTAVQMGGCLADQIQNRFRMGPEWRHVFLLAGLAAGFGSVFGVPWAGCIFALEVLRLSWPVRWIALPFCIGSAWIAHASTLFLGVRHTAYPVLTEVPWTAPLIFQLGLLGILSGFMAFGFVRLTHGIQAISARWIRYTPYRTMAGGAVIGLVLHIWGYRYAGLGIPVIVEAFSHTSHWFDPLVKLLMTAVSVGSGFKGGEVTPLLFTGATLGSSFAEWSQQPLVIMTGVGLVSVLAGAINAPLACAVMAGELMGWQMGVLALPACLLSYLFSGHVGIYHAQVKRTAKPLHVGLLLKKWRPSR